MKEKILYLLGMMFIGVGIINAQDKLTVSLNATPVFEYSPFQQKVFLDFFTADELFKSEIQNIIVRLIADEIERSAADYQTSYAAYVKARRAAGITQGNDVCYQLQMRGKLRVAINAEQVAAIELPDRKKICVKNIEDFMDQRIKNIVTQKLTDTYNAYLRALRTEWEPKLKANNITIPIDDVAFAEVAFSQPNYKNAAQRAEQKKLAIVPVKGRLGTAPDEKFTIEVAINPDLSVATAKSLIEGEAHRQKGRANMYYVAYFMGESLENYIHYNPNDTVKTMQGKLTQPQGPQMPGREPQVGFTVEPFGR